MKDLRYGILDNQPVMFTDQEAWIYKDGAWITLHPADPANNAALLSKAEFDQLFPSLKALPTSAFQSDGSLSNAR